MKSSKHLAITFLVVLSGIFLLGSCDDFIAKDISEEMPVLIMPQSGDTIAANPVHFKWNEVSGATTYRLEIVSPSFANINVFAIDSIVSGTEFFVSLDSASYQIRLTAINAGYSSKTSAPVSFSVGTSQGAQTEVVVLNSPANAAYFNETFDGQFSWEIYNGANHYLFELHEGSSFSGTTVDIIPDIQSWTVTSNDGSQLHEGQYTWGVKAYVNSSETAYSKRTFYIDTTDPGTATLLSPTNSQFVLAGDIAFSWNLPTDNGEIQSPLISQLQIATNTSFSGAQLLTVNGTTRTVTLSAGTYYWRVKLTDSAGNAGNTPTTYYTLHVQ